MTPYRALPEWADFLCFGQDAPVTWQAGDNTQLARYAKLNPHLVLPGGYDYCLWIDGNIDVVDPAFFSKVEEMMAGGVLYAGLHHPQRDDVYEESLRILQNDRESFCRLARLVKFLRKEGFPRHYGLDETNVILRRHNDPKVREFDELWWEMLRTWTNRDQMTQSWCFRKTGLQHVHFLPQGQCAQNHGPAKLHNPLNTRQIDSLLRVVAPSYSMNCTHTGAGMSMVPIR